MSKIRRIAALIGLLSVFSAVLISFAPGLVPQGSVPAGSLIGMALVGILLLLFGLYGLGSFRISSVEESDLEIKMNKIPETVEDKSSRKKIQFNWKEKEEGVEEIRDAVGQILIQYKGYTADEATEAVKKGTWTDDKVAAAFLHKELKYPIFGRLREWLEEEDESFERRVSRAVKAVENLYEEVEN